MVSDRCQILSNRKINKSIKALSISTFKSPENFTKKNFSQQVNINIYLRNLLTKCYHCFIFPQQTSSRNHEIHVQQGKRSIKKNHRKILQVFNFHLIERDNRGRCLSTADKLIDRAYSLVLQHSRDNRAPISKYLTGIASSV